MISSADEIQIKILFGKKQQFCIQQLRTLDMSLLTYGNKHDATLIEQAIEKEFKQINPGC